MPTRTDPSARLREQIDTLYRVGSAWKQIANNLALALELHNLGGIASLTQQQRAHDLDTGPDAAPRVPTPARPEIAAQDITGALECPFCGLLLDADLRYCADCGEIV